LSVPAPASLPPLSFNAGSLMISAISALPPGRPSASRAVTPQLDRLLQRLSAATNRLETKVIALGRAEMDAELAEAAAMSAAARLPLESPSNVYYHRELLTRSVDGRRIDLLTISSKRGFAERPQFQPSQWYEPALETAPDCSRSISMHVLTTAPLPHRYEPALEPAMLPEIERGVKAWWEGLPPPPRARSFPNKKVSVLLIAC
jgi:hypothetical protein